MHLNGISPNDYYSQENPLLHFLLANENFDDFARFLQLTPQRIDPNQCDGETFGKKSLLIILTLLVSNQSLIYEFIDLFKRHINFDYQDSEGKTALHYAVILGRHDLVKQLIESGASWDIGDRDNQRPIDYLYNRTYIVNSLSKIDINPSRDLNALRNHLYDHQGRSLTLQGSNLVQNKEILTRVINSSLVLYRYISGREDQWISFVGDNTDSTHQELYNTAIEISKHFKVPFPEVFTKQELGPEEQEEFHEKLTLLHQHLSGTTVLEHCLSGQKQVELYLDSIITQGRAPK